MDPAIRDGRYIALDAAGTLSSFMNAGSPDPERFHQVLGTILTQAARNASTERAQLAIYGEMVSLLWSDGKPEAAIQLEQLWNELAGKHSFSLLCGYPLQAFNQDEHGELFQRICAEHSHVVPAESFSVLGDENERLRSIARLQQRAHVLEGVRAQREELQLHASAIQGRNLELVEEVKQREKSEDRLRKITSRLLADRDEEQRKIAAELHENTAQELAVLGINLDLLKQEYETPTPRASQILSQSSALVQDLLKEIRTLSHMLHPPLLGPLGLTPTLRSFVHEFTVSTGIPVSLGISEDIKRLSSDLEFTIFRIVQQLLTNLLLPASSSTASVRLSLIPQSAVVEVRSQSVGHSLEKPALSADSAVGILWMQERVQQLGGSFDIHSGPSGTAIIVKLPLGLNTLQ